MPTECAEAPDLASWHGLLLARPLAMPLVAGCSFRFDKNCYYSLDSKCVSFKDIEVLVVPTTAHSKQLRCLLGVRDQGSKEVSFVLAYRQ